MRAASLLTLPALLLAAAPAAAAPEAHLFRIDARSAPTITTLLEVSQPRRLADVIVPCSPLTGNAYVDCLGDTLERPGALASSFAFPEKNALFTIAIDGADTPLAFESAARWGESSAASGVGTAWLVLVDASVTMAPRLDDAKEIALAFIDSMRPNDVVDVLFFNDSGVVLDSQWVNDKARATAALAGVPSVFPQQRAARTLADVIRTAATDAFKDLSSPRANAPLHQALVLVSDAERGDASSGAPGAAALRDDLSLGRFGKSPKMPVPVVSVWLPSASAPPAQARDFMMGIANPELGGFFTAVRAGRKGRGPGIVSAVRGRFDKMHLVKWRLTCRVMGPTQSFRLAFTNTTPPIAGDATFKDVPYNGPGLAPCKK